MKLTMGAFILSLLWQNFARAGIEESSASGPTPCDGQLIIREQYKGHTRISIPLEGYIASLGLKEKLHSVVPLDQVEDLFAPIDPAKVRMVSFNQYPFETFALASNMQKMAVRFDNSYFPMEVYKERAPHIFVSAVQPQRGVVRHLAEIALPHNAHGDGPFFLRGDQALAIEGSWTEGDGQNKQLRQDIFFYDLSNGSKPRLVARLSEVLHRSIGRLTPIDSPDRGAQILFVETATAGRNTEYVVVRIDFVTGQVQEIVRTKMPRVAGSNVQSMEYDDDRRGFMDLQAKGVRFISAYAEVHMSHAGEFRIVEPDRGHRHFGRSSGSAWLMMQLDDSQTRLIVRDELSGQQIVYKSPVTLD
ncbi:MAG: hypothetical protein AB7N80_08910, partial [Bdellovibrionales bacterium]